MFETLTIFFFQRTSKLYATTSNVVTRHCYEEQNEVLCAAAGRLAAERSEADKPAKAHKTIFAPNKIYYLPS
jgi:hypothetical protein